MSGPTPESREQQPPAAEAGEDRLATGATSTTGATVMSGGVWNGLTLLLPQLYTLVVSVAAARALGPEGMGRQSFIAFVEISLIVVLTAGLSVSLARYVAETVGEGRLAPLRGLLRWAWRVATGAALLGGGVLASVALLDAELSGAWLLAAVSCALGILHTVPSSVLSGLQRWREAALVGIVTGLVASGLTVVVLAAGAGITGMFAVEAVISLANLVWTGTLARRRLDALAPPAGPAHELIRKTGRFAVLTWMSQLLAFVVWRRTEFFFLKRYSTPGQIAFYSIAFSASTALVRLPEALAAVLGSAVATLLGAGEMERIRAGFARGARLLVLVSLPLTSGAVALGPAVLELVYGESYRASGPVFVVLLASLPLLPLVTLSDGLLAGLAHARVPLAAGAAATVVNLALDFVLIPRFGAVGAAGANATAQLSAGIPVVVYACHRAGPMRWEAGFLLRAAAASAAAGVIASSVLGLVGGAAGIVAAAMAWAGVFLGIAALVHVISREDADWLTAHVGPRSRAMVGATCRLLSGPNAPG